MLERLIQKLPLISHKKDLAGKVGIRDGLADLSKASSSSFSLSFTVQIPVNVEGDGDDAATLVGASGALLPVPGRRLTRPDNSASYLLSLPAEILLLLQCNFTPCAQVSLRQSCSRFLHLYSRPSPNLAGDDRFTFVCHLERDRKPNRSCNSDRLVCSHCRGMHAKSTFSSTEQRKPAHQRDCRQLWLCLHRALDFRQVAHRIRAVETAFRVEDLDPCVQCKALIRDRSVADRPEWISEPPPMEIHLLRRICYR